jgi:hypothetical protein
MSNATGAYDPDRVRRGDLPGFARAERMPAEAGFAKEEIESLLAGAIVTA